MNKPLHFYLRFFIISALSILISCSEDHEPVIADNNKSANIELITKIDVTEIILGSVITIKTNITDEDGEVIKTKLMVDGNDIETITSPPFNFTWNTQSEIEGVHQITIIAIDNKELSTSFKTKVVLSENFTCGNDFFDPRDGNIYKTVKIGDQCWMAQNLNFKTEEGSWDYDDNPENGEKYGKLYEQEAALMVSPEGWHLPSDKEWKILEGNVDTQFEVGSEEWDNHSYRGFDAGDNLKSESGWDENGNGKNKFGFNALPGGYKIIHSDPSSDFYENLNFSAPFWTSTSAGSKLLWGRELFAPKQSIHRIFSGDYWAMGIRCIKD